MLSGKSITENKKVLKSIFFSHRVLSFSQQCANNWASQSTWRNISVIGTHQFKTHTYSIYCFYHVKADYSRLPSILIKTGCMLFLVYESSLYSTFIFQITIRQFGVEEKRKTEKVQMTRRDGIINSK